MNATQTWKCNECDGELVVRKRDPGNHFSMFECRVKTGCSGTMLIAAYEGENPTHEWVANPDHMIEGVLKLAPITSFQTRDFRVN